MSQSIPGDALPLILVVSGDERVRQGLVPDIGRRFGADYTVAAAATTDAALDRLEAQVGQAETALVILDERLPRAPADFLLRVHRLHPHAKRVLLIKRGNWSSAHPVVAEMALGQVDYHLFDPWFPLERILYPSISEFLAAWNTGQEAPVVAVRIVGQQQDARSHEVRDMLTRASVPYWFFTPDSESGREVLAEVGKDGSRLPVLLFYSGEVTGRSEQRRGDRGPRDEQPAHDRLVRRPRRRRRTRRAGRGCLRGVRRSADHGGRTRDPRWTGRYQLVDPQLPRLPQRGERWGAGDPGHRAGVAVRGGLRTVPARHQARPRGGAPARAHHGRQRGGRPGRRAGHGGRVAAVERSRPGGTGRGRGVLRGGRRRGAGGPGWRRGGSRRRATPPVRPRFISPATPGRSPC